MVCSKQIQSMIIFLFICCLTESDLIADIFGKSDDEDEAFSGFGEDEPTASKTKSMVYDFDLMMEKKQQERFVVGIVIK